MQNKRNLKDILVGTWIYEEGWVIENIRKMVELPEPQFRKMVELLTPKIVTKFFFLKIIVPTTAPRSILIFRVTLYIKFDHKWQVFSKFRHFDCFRKINSFQNFLKFRQPKHSKITFWLLLLEGIYRKNGRTIRTFLKTGRWSISFGHHSSSFGHSGNDYILLTLM